MLEYRPGILGPSQAFVRDESSLCIPQGRIPSPTTGRCCSRLRQELTLPIIKMVLWLLTSAGSSAASWWYSASIRIAQLVMNVRSNQHAEAPASWHIADLVKLLAAEYEDELQSGIGANANLRSRGEPSHVLEAESLISLPNEASSHKVELV